MDKRLLSVTWQLLKNCISGKWNEAAMDRAKSQNRSFLKVLRCKEVIRKNREGYFKVETNKKRR